MDIHDDAYGWIAALALSDPQRPCLSGSDGRCLSYADVDHAAGLHGAALAALGVDPGSRVAVQVDRSLEAVLIYLACLRIGAVMVPLNTAYTANELEFFLRDSEPRLLLARPEAEEMAAGAAERARCPRVETLGTKANGTYAARVAAQSAPAPIASLPGGTLASLLYTSGTTARPKGAMITRANLHANARALVASWHMSAQDTLLHVLPLFHVHGLFLSRIAVLELQVLRRLESQVYLELQGVAAYSEVMRVGGVRQPKRRSINAGMSRSAGPKNCATLRWCP